MNLVVFIDIDNNTRKKRRIEREKKAKIREEKKLLKEKENLSA